MSTQRMLVPREHTHSSHQGDEIQVFDGRLRSYMGEPDELHAPSSTYKAMLVGSLSQDKGCVGSTCSGIEP